MKIKIADPNPQVFGIELLLGLLILLLMNAGIVGMIGDILLIIGVGNLSYFVVSLFKANRLIKSLVGIVIFVVTLVILYALIGSLNTSQ